MRMTHLQARGGSRGLKPGRGLSARAFDNKHSSVFTRQSERDKSAAVMTRSRSGLSLPPGACLFFSLSL